MRVLVVNHTGLISGAEIAALDLLHSLPHDVEATLACPDGPLAERARDSGITVATVAGMTGSLRLHPVETARGVRDLARLGWQIRALSRRKASDVVHAASIRAGLAAALPLGPRPPVLVSLHDCLPPGALTLATQRLIDATAAAVVSNSHYSAAAWRDG